MKDVIMVVVGIIVACVLFYLLIGDGNGLLSAIKNLFVTQVNMLGD